MKKDTGEYALYKGEEILSIGTIDEISEEMGVKRNTINYYKSNAYKRRIEKRNVNDNARILIYLD